jgi:hypothetical protein
MFRSGAVCLAPFVSEMLVETVKPANVAVLPPLQICSTVQPLSM